MMTDPIADMLTRIRNANRIGNRKVDMPASRIRVGIANVLRDEGFIDDYAVEEGKPSSTLHVTLRYGIDGEKVIRSIERLSKPGRRAYAGVKELKPVLRTARASVSSRRPRAFSRTARRANSASAANFSPRSTDPGQGERYTAMSRIGKAPVEIPSGVHRGRQGSRRERQGPQGQPVA